MNLLIVNEFFQVPARQLKIRRMADLMLGMHESENIFRLGQMLNMLANMPAEFDKGCFVNIEMVGNSFDHELEKAAPPYSYQAIDIFSSFVYRFLTEYDISVYSDLSIEVRAFLSYIDSRVPEMPPTAQANVEYANRRMPVSILKHILNSGDISNIRDISTYKINLENKINDWEARIAAESEKAEKLSTVFQKHATAFNFVGLQQGFKDLELIMENELTWAQRGLWLFGALVLVPGLYDLFLVLFKREVFQLFTVYNLIAAAVGTLTLTLLILYFFRIILRKADGCRAQLIQIRLRMSLCRFIQSYADYSKDIREKNPDVLSKFESLIFAPITDSSEKLPSTFDGIEQLSKLFKSLQGKP